MASTLILFLFQTKTFFAICNWHILLSLYTNKTLGERTGYIARPVRNLL